MKESISALMDDEANELEVQRLLSRSDSEQLLETWKRYHSARDLLSGMRGQMVEVDVASRVASAIRGEAQDYTGDEQPKPESHKAALEAEAVESVGEVGSSRAWKFGGAIAACLVVAFGFSGFGGNGLTGSGELASGVETADSNQLVMNELDESQVSSFNQYLLRHSELSTVTVASGVAPLIRVASVNSVGI